MKGHQYNSIICLRGHQFRSYRLLLFVWTYISHLRMHKIAGCCKQLFNNFRRLYPESSWRGASLTATKPSIAFAINSSGTFMKNDLSEKFMIFNQAPSN